MRRKNRWNPKRLWARVAGDDGSAALEFIVGGVVLLVPLAYLIITLGIIQEQTLGAEATARHIARVVAAADSADAASAQSDAVLRSMVEQYGMSDDVAVSMTCTPAGVPCPSAGATVIVSVSTVVSLPFVPPIFGLDRAASIPLEAMSAQKMSRTWGSE